MVSKLNVNLEIIVRIWITSAYLCEKVQNSSDLPKMKFYLVSPHVSTKSRYHFLMDPNQLLFIIARFMLERLETLTPGFQVPRKALEGTASLVYCYFRQLELLLLVRTPEVLDKAIDSVEALE